jgi:hypothetical protein
MKTAGILGIIVVGSLHAGSGCHKRFILRQNAIVDSALERDVGKPTNQKLNYIYQIIKEYACWPVIESPKTSLGLGMYGQARLFCGELPVLSPLERTALSYLSTSWPKLSQSRDLYNYELTTQNEFFCLFFAFREQSWRISFAGNRDHFTQLMRAFFFLVYLKAPTSKITICTNQNIPYHQIHDDIKPNGIFKGRAKISKKYSGEQENRGIYQYIVYVYPQAWYPCAEAQVK